MSQNNKKVEAYLGGLPPERREALEKLREVVRAAAPEASETMRYNMPTYELGGEVVCAFASQKHYMSLYMDTEIVAQHKGELEHLNVGKSCIRFRKLEKLPLDAVKVMLKETIVKQASGRQS